MRKGVVVKRVLNKKGQVSVFIIVGMLVASVVFFAWSLRSYSASSLRSHGSVENGAAVRIAYDTAVVQDQVERCVGDLAERSLITVGYYGGNDGLVGPYFDGELLDSNFLFVDGTAFEPTVADTQNALDSLMRKNVESCLPNSTVNSPANFSSVVDYSALYAGLFIESMASPNVTSHIADEAVVFDVHWPLALREDEKIVLLSDFSPDPFPVHLKSMTSAAALLVHQLETYNSTLDALALLDQNVTYTITPVDNIVSNFTDMVVDNSSESLKNNLYNNSTYLITITDNTSLIDYRPLTFLFAAQISEDSLGVHS